MDTCNITNSFMSLLTKLSKILKYYMSTAQQKLS